MAKRSILFLVFVLLFSSITLAGEIFGTLREGGKAVAKGIKVEIITPKKTYSTVTDAYGSYRLFVVEKGKCTLSVSYKNQNASFELYSYDKSTRLDMSLEAKDGKYSLKRK
ncbi:MAG TPA: carboxypeptidase-like regulatory domain-containing protein [Bacteroidota bacterium]|nr:carboxypeptidase-like regulatory domain-containing protein [Bacteroidota bacterium]